MSVTDCAEERQVVCVEQVVVRWVRERGWGR